MLIKVATPLIVRFNCIHLNECKKRMQYTIDVNGTVVPIMVFVTINRLFNIGSTRFWSEPQQASKGTAVFDVAA